MTLNARKRIPAITEEPAVLIEPSNLCVNCGEPTKTIVLWKSGEYVPLCAECGKTIRTEETRNSR